MEIIERPNMTAVKFLNSIKYETFKTDCINDAEVVVASRSQHKPGQLVSLVT